MWRAWWGVQARSAGNAPILPLTPLTPSLVSPWSILSFPRPPHSSLPLLDSAQLSPPLPFAPSGLLWGHRQDTPTRLSGLTLCPGVPGTRRLPHPAAPQPSPSPSPASHRPHPSRAPDRPGPVSLTGWQGEEAEREDGAVHAVALPPRAHPHHVLDPHLQLAQQRLGPAARTQRAPRRFHGLRAAGSAPAEDSEDPERLRRRAG